MDRGSRGLFPLQPRSTWHEKPTWREGLQHSWFKVETLHNEDPVKEERGPVPLRPLETPFNLYLQ